MLFIARLTDGTGKYYLGDLMAEPRFPEISAGVSISAGAGADAGTGNGGGGRWLGRGAVGLGLVGPVRGPDLAAILTGRNPGSSTTLSRSSRKVTAYDLTFAAPKSVSVLMAVGGPRVAAEVGAAHISAVDGAMEYVEKRAAAVRRGIDGDRELLPVGGVIGAAFDHVSSRAGDPHLHTHVVVANLAHGQDGRWSAIDGRGLHAHVKAAGALYDAALRFELTSRMGVGWRRTPHGRYEVDHIDPTVLAGFSSRQAEIREHLADRSLPPGGGATGRRPSPRAAHVAWAATREEKGEGESWQSLCAQWQRQAESLGFGSEDLGCALDRPDASRTAGIDEYRFAALLVTSPHATAARRDAIEAWAGSLDTGASARDVEHCVDLLGDWGNEIGVAEPHRALGSLFPRAHQMRTLGSRPGGSRKLVMWLQGAARLEDYRVRWKVEDRQESLGIAHAPNALAGMSTSRLVDHLRTVRAVDEVCRRLGRTVRREAEMRTHGLERE